MLKRSLENKRIAILVSALAVIALFALASALRNVTFRPAQPLLDMGKEQAHSAPIQIREIARMIAEIPLWENIALAGFGILIMALIAYMLTPEARKRLLVLTLRVAAFIFIFLYVIEHNPALLENLLGEPEIQTGVSATYNAEEESAPLEFQSPQIPPVLSFVFTLGITLLAAGGIWFAYRQVSLIARQKESSPLDEIKKAARTSLRRMKTEGGESRDKIIQCYEEMSRALNEQRGLNRGYAMTAAEFAARLEDAGLPREPVHRLTRLFESARYGEKTSQAKDIEEAVSCLKDILLYCGELA